MTSPLETLRRGALYVALTVVGAGAFLYPFWLPDSLVPDDAAAPGVAPLTASLVGLLALGAVLLEVRRGTMGGATVAVLGVLSAMAGMLKLLDLPGGGSGLFFLLILGGAAFGPRFGFLLGLTSFAAAALITGGIGPWLPFQMLTLAWMGASFGFVGRATRSLAPRTEVVVLAGLAWLWGFAYGAIMNLTFWPWFVGESDLTWQPGLSAAETLRHYWSFYVATSLAWDAAGALANACATVVLGVPVLRSLRRFAPRLAPVASFPAASARPVLAAAPAPE